MHAFDHYTPQTLSETFELLERQNGQTQLIAGGSDLLIKMKKGLVAPATIINLKRLPELKGVSYSPETGLRLGALTTLGELTRLPMIRQYHPCLARTAGLMASRQIRNFATVGGNLCNASPAADTAPPLIALGATVHLVGPQGERNLPLEDFFLGVGQTALAANELLQWIDVPPPAGEAVYIKHVPRAYMDISVVGVCAWLQLNNNVCQLARIVLGAVAPVPMRAKQAEAMLAGQPLTPARVAEAANLAAREARPIDDVGGSARYRRRMVEVGARRCLERILDFAPSRHGGF